MEVLLIGAVACATALILSAWLMTFARWFPIKGIDGDFLVDYKTMIRAHVDYTLMALFNLGFLVQPRQRAWSCNISLVSVLPLAALPTRPFLPSLPLTQTSGARPSGESFLH